MVKGPPVLHFWGSRVDVPFGLGVVCATLPQASDTDAAQRCGGCHSARSLVPFWNTCARMRFSAAAARYNGTW
jgi:hypothetical protein